MSPSLSVDVDVLWGVRVDHLISASATKSGYHQYDYEDWPVLVLLDRKSRTYE